MAMLGSSCSPCCTQTQCGCPPGQSLPDAVTVTFSGITKEATKIGSLLGLSITSCFGSGASGTVTAEGGFPTAGFPLSSVALESPGSGYAKLGRVQPVLSISGTGTGATFTPTLTSIADACGVHSWQISSVAVSGGAGYSNSERLTVTIETGGTEAAGAVLRVQTNIRKPTLTASASGGTGAAFSVALSENFGSSPTTWAVSSVAVTNGGAGYSDGSPLSFAGGIGLKIGRNAQAYIATGRAVPTLTASAFGSGTGAIVSPTLTQYTLWNGRSYWSVTGFTIANGGSGYAEFNEVVVYISEGKAIPWSYFYAYVSSVDENGSITGITIDGGGMFYKDTGVIESVDLWFGGAYHDDEGIPVSVAVFSGGEYYKEDATVAPYVASVSVSITQIAPSDGVGGIVSAVVEDDTSSPLFGKIVGFQIDNAGEGYLGWSLSLRDCDAFRFNDKTFTLDRESPTSCRYIVCDGPSFITVAYGDALSPPTVSISTSVREDRRYRTQCEILFSANQEDGPFGCDPLEFVAVDLLGATATVAPATATSKPSCEDIYNASSFTVAIEAQNWLKHMRRYSSLCGRWMTLTNAFNGSAMSGSYSLTYTGMYSLEYRAPGLPVGFPPLAKTWAYYSGSLTTCDAPYIQMQVAKYQLLHEPTFRYVVYMYVSFPAGSYLDKETESFKSIGGFACEWANVPPPFSGGCEGYSTTKTGDLIGGIALCGCDLNAISSLGAEIELAVSGGGFGSADGFPAVTETVFESGSRKARITSVTAEL